MAEAGGPAGGGRQRRRGRAREQQGQGAAVVLPAPGPGRAAAGRRGGRLGARSCLYIHRNPRLREQLEVAIAERAAAGLDAAGGGADRGAAPVPGRGGVGAGEPGLTAARPCPRFKPPRVFAARRRRPAAPWCRTSRRWRTWPSSRATAPAGSAPPAPRTSPAACWPRCTRPTARRAWSRRALGTPIADLLRLATAQAVLVGGYHGAWLTRCAGRTAAARQRGAPPARRGRRRRRAGRAARRTGAASPRPPAWSRYLALESAGQCGPCLNGLPRIAAALAELAGPRPGPRRCADLRALVGPGGRPRRLPPPRRHGPVRRAARCRSSRPRSTTHAHGYCTGTTGRPFLPVPAEPPLDDADWS